MTEYNDVRVGFVGLGNIAHFHADALVDLGATIAGGMDVDEDARRSFGDTYDVPTYADAADLFEDIDAVLISTPNRFHETYAVHALEEGLDVLVEKPLADSLESAERIAEAARAADGVCMVGFHNRFLALVEVLAAYRDDGFFGDIDHIDANYVRRRGIPGRGSWFTRSDVAGGGSVVDIGTHIVDLSLYLAGFPTVTEVTASTRSVFGTREDYAYLEMWGDDQGPGAFDVEDSAHAFVRCDDGTTVSIDVAWASNREPSTDFVLQGTGGGAQFDFNEEELRLFETSNRGASHHRTTTVDTDGEEPHTAQDRYFLEVAAGERQLTRNSFEEGLVVQRVIDAIYRSNEEQRAISLE